MKKEFSPARLDVQAFAEHGGQLAGQEPLARFARLAAEALEGAGEAVTWSARGELRNPGHLQPQVWLHLDARTRLAMICQRCLHRVDLPVQAQRSFRFVADEDTAAAQDDQAEEDVLAISRSFDLPALVEDELLMALPLVPRHEACPEPVTLSSGRPGFEAAEQGRESPFAQLRKLKGDGP